MDDLSEKVQKLMDEIWPSKDGSGWVYKPIMPSPLGGQVRDTFHLNELGELSGGHTTVQITGGKKRKLFWEEEVDKLARLQELLTPPKVETPTNLLNRLFPSDKEEIGPALKPLPPNPVYEAARTRAFELDRAYPMYGFGPDLPDPLGPVVSSCTGLSKPATVGGSSSFMCKGDTQASDWG